MIQRIYIWNIWKIIQVQQFSQMTHHFLLTPKHIVIESLFFKKDF